MVTLKVAIPVATLSPNSTTKTHFYQNIPAPVSGIVAQKGVDGLQFEVSEGARFIPRFIASFSEADKHLQILSISLRRPTLDDVFLKITGRAIRHEAADARDQQRAIFKLQRR